MALRRAPLALLGCATHAFPSFREFVPNGRRVPCPESGEECQAGDPSQCEAELTCNGLGHRTCRGGTLPLNVFGEAFEEAGHRWTQELCEADSDGDGLTNGEELGDPCCLWVAGSAPSEYTKRFTPTHPGVADPSATLAAYGRPSCGETPPVVAGISFGEFNADEEQRTVDVYIKSHEVPATRTNYIDFIINIPDSAWEGGGMFYLIKADAIIDKKEVLHHYIINGCSKKVPEDQDGAIANGRAERDYNCYHSLGGWAPGSFIANMPPWIGAPFGPAAGIVALSVQIHYDNPRLASGIFDASGVRFWYTPTAREFPLSGFSTMTVSVNEQIVVPPKKERWFLTRTCTLNIQDSDAAPIDFHLFGLSYHAHLLGTEMFTEYFPVDGGDSLDLGSEHVWHFDDQYQRDMLALDITLRTGDRIQSTCVMNSMHLEDDTVFGLETIDEMCWAQYKGWSSTPGVAASVSCEGPVWTGELLPTEPAFGLSARHPVDKAPDVWDGRAGMELTAGFPLRLKGEDCVDATEFCAFMAPMALASMGATICDQDLKEISPYNAYEEMHGMSITDICCATACAHEHCHMTEKCLEQKSVVLGTGVFDAIALSEEPFYVIRTMGCSSDAGMLKTVSVRLPEELLTESARSTTKSEVESAGKASDGAASGRSDLFLPLVVGLTAYCTSAV